MAFVFESIQHRKEKKRKEKIVKKKEKEQKHKTKRKNNLVNCVIWWNSTTFFLLLLLFLIYFLLQKERRKRRKKKKKIFSLFNVPLIVPLIQTNRFWLTWILFIFCDFFSASFLFLSSLLTKGIEWMNDELRQCVHWFLMEFRLKLNFLYFIFSSSLFEPVIKVTKSSFFIVLPRTILKEFFFSFNKMKLFAMTTV